MKTEMTERVEAGWRNWKKCSGVYDRRSLQNSDQASDAVWPVWGRNIGYDETQIDVYERRML